MYLYVWEEVGALEDYLPGMAFAHAGTKTRAIKYVLRAVLKEMYEFLAGHPGSTWRRRDSLELMRRLSKELREKEPIVYNKDWGIAGYAIHGSA